MMSLSFSSRKKGSHRARDFIVIWRFEANILLMETSALRFVTTHTPKFPCRQKGVEDTLSPVDTRAIKSFPKMSDTRISSRTLALYLILEILKDGGLAGAENFNDVGR